MAEDKHFLLRCSQPHWPEEQREKEQISHCQAGLYYICIECGAIEEISDFEGTLGFFL